MATGPLRHVQRYLRRLVAARVNDELSDAELVRRFVARRDELAFTILLERHGAMVLGVCRCVLRDTHDAHDAFQATFLVFLRKASSIRRREVVGSWLYAVAHRVAVRLKTQIARRRTVERVDPELAEIASPTEEGTSELGSILEEEVHRLPKKYRTPIVLCYLEGKSNDEAAQQLCWPLGTVKARLDRARKLLRRRLAQRGLTPSATALAAGLCEGAAKAAVPISLVEATARAFGKFPVTGTTEISARSLLLAQGVLRTMFITKSITIIGLVLGVGALVASGGVLHHALADKSDGKK